MPAQRGAAGLVGPHHGLHLHHNNEQIWKNFKSHVFLDLMIIFLFGMGPFDNVNSIHICRIILIISQKCLSTRAVQWTFAVEDCCWLSSVMLTKFSAWLDHQPIRLVFQSPDLSVWNLSYYLPILIFVISSFILVSLAGWAFYNHYLSTYDIQREVQRVTLKNSKLYLLVFIDEFCQLLNK